MFETIQVEKYNLSLNFIFYNTKSDILRQRKTIKL